MRALIQRVQQAKVVINGEIKGEIGQGYLIFLGVGAADNEEIAAKLWQKIYKLRIFEDEQGKTNLDLATVGGDVLIVSQFTLWANTKKGNRPSFIASAPAKQAEDLYEYFVAQARQDVAKVETGSFGADMKVSLLNDGPFTLWMDTDEWQN